MQSATLQRVPLKTLLRVAILAEVLLGVFSALLDIALQSKLPEPLRNYLAAESESWSATDNIVLVIGVPMVVATIVGWIGLWRLWRPARSIYLYSWLAGLLLTAFSGPAVSSAFGYTLSDASVLSAGLILGLIYFSDLRHAFDRRENI